MPSPSKQDASHRFVEHTGEVELRLFAAEFGELYAEAGRALARLMLEEAEEASKSTVMLRVEAEDRQELLFEWLNELIYHSEVEKVVFVDFSILEISEGHLVAEATALRPLRLRTAVKAATFHDLCVVHTGDGWSATVVLDV